MTTTLRRPSRRQSLSRPELNAKLLVRMRREDILWFRRHALDCNEPMAEIVRRVLTEYRNRIDHKD
jgi:hypothetical protein